MCKYIDFVAYNVIYPIMKQEDQYKFLIDNGFNVVFNKQTNKSAQSEVDGLMGEYKSFILDYDFGATGATVDTLKAAIDAYYEQYGAK